MANAVKRSHDDALPLITWQHLVLLLVCPGRATSVLETLTGVQTTLGTTATYSGPSNQAAVKSDPARRKRGRPKDSKNKSKPGQLAAKQSRSTEQVLATQNRSTTPRRSLDKVLTEHAASAEVPHFVQGADTELPMSAAESTVLPPTPTTVVPSGNPKVLPNEGLPDLAHSIATEPATPASSQRAKRIPVPLVLSMYVDIHVAFSPAKAGFIIQKKKYAGVGNAFLVGRVCRLLKRSLFQVNWLDSQFQKHGETLNLSAVQRGNAKYRSLHGRSTGVGWGRLCTVDDGEEVMIEQYMESFEPPGELPTSLAEVEAVKSMRFEPENPCDAHPDLYQHSDGSTKTRLRPKFKHIFQH
ncbi:unnamed protein product [Phytophthora fragariaefolia]|uniref:Unnamed protein product n=1 Tax=Phytophthora fragariaefolia TaxID=1490495 RepID=A0A9W7D7N4_9STRA|nr:unnamed protein product [Phytophthora fragariaefolia]